MSEEYRLHSRPVKAEPLIEAVIGLATSPRALDASEITEIIDKSEPYARAVVQLGTELDLLMERGESYSVSPEIEEEARRMSPEQGFVLLNRQAQRYQPFMTFLSYLDKGYDPERSATTVKTLYEMNISSDVLQRQFVNLGTTTDLLDENDGLRPTIEVESLPVRYVEDLQEALLSEAKARLFVHERLGDDVVAYAEDESIEKFREALLSHRESPENAIVNAVVGSENITRELAVEQGKPDSDYTQPNGIGSLANMMRGDDLILKRHLHGANFLGAMRIPGAHGKESETLESWQVDSEVALEVILSSMSFVRSIYYSVKEDRQIL